MGRDGLDEESVADSGLEEECLCFDISWVYICGLGEERNVRFRNRLISKKHKLSIYEKHC